MAQVSSLGKEEQREVWADSLRILEAAVGVIEVRVFGQVLGTAMEIFRRRVQF